MTKHRILIALTSHAVKGSTGQKTGAYAEEIAQPYDVFVRAGCEVEFASVRGGAVPLDGLDTRDEVTRAFLDDEQITARLHASAPSAQVDAGRYDAIFFAGGHGTMWDLPSDPGFRALTAALYERGAVVAAVCHGPAALVGVTLRDEKPLVAGKTVSAFTNDEERAVGLDRVVPFLLEDRLVSLGATFSSAPRWQAHVVTSERLVTGQNPASARGVAEATLRALDVGR